MRVSLFVTCLVDQVRPSAGVAAVELLRKHGCDIVFNPAQTCCGQPAYTMGNTAECLAVAKHTIEQLEAERADWIVIPSGSCGAMFHHYPKLFEQEEWRTRAASISEKVRELSAFLVDVLDIQHVNARYDGRVTWHDACHGLRDLRLHDQPRKLLRRVAGLDLVESQMCDACCGFGGAFSVTYPGISTAMADRKLDEMESLGVNAVVSADVGCLMQLGDRLRERGSSIQTMHIAELLTAGT